MQQQVGRQRPQRSCVVCRRAAAARELLRLVVIDEKVVAADAVESAAGRGLYVCLTRACLLQLDGKSLSRACKRMIRGVDALQFANELHIIAANKVLETLGLARRMGVLDFGVEQLAQGGDRWPVRLVARDLSARSRRCVGQCTEFLASEQLCRATGRAVVGAMGIRPGRLAERAAYWLAAWEATRPALSSSSSDAAAQGAAALAGTTDDDGVSGAGLLGLIEVA